MDLRILSIKEIEEIYNNYMVEAFPKDEIRPFTNIEMLYKRGNYICLGGFDPDLKIYAFFCIDNSTKTAMLDYFATTASARGKGYGSDFFKSFLGKMPEIQNVLLEVEDADFAVNEKDLQVRERRINFYERCGCKASRVKAEVWGVKFMLMYLNDDIVEDSYIYELMDKIYSIIFPPEIRSSKIKLKLQKN